MLGDELYAFDRLDDFRREPRRHLIGELLDAAGAAEAAPRRPSAAASGTVDRRQFVETLEIAAAGRRRRDDHRRPVIASDAAASVRVP